MLEAPKKAGDTFVGWTGSNGEEPQREVIIPIGSTGKLEFYANFLNSGRKDEVETDLSDGKDKVWAVENDLYIRTSKAGSVVRVYSLDGVLREQRIIISPELTKIKLTRGVFIITINNDLGKKIKIE